MSKQHYDTVSRRGLHATAAWHHLLAGYTYDGAIMITASHLPYQRNGFKFFTAEGGLEHEDIEDVLSRAAQAAAAAGVQPDNEFLGTAYVMTMALGVPAGLISQVCCVGQAAMDPQG